MYIVMGLGNPGDGYKKSRHNVGRMAIGECIKKFSFSKLEEDDESLISRGEISGKEVVFLAPLTYMNNSGRVLNKYMLSEFERLVVIHDDIDIPLGKLKISFGRGAGGHKGVSSVAKYFGGLDFYRIRIGISPVDQSGELKKPSSDDAVSDFVLNNFNKKDEEKLKEVLEKIPSAISSLVLEGGERAMNQFNTN